MAKTMIKIIFTVFLVYVLMSAQAVYVYSIMGLKGVFLLWFVVFVVTTLALKLFKKLRRWVFGF